MKPMKAEVKSARKSADGKRETVGVAEWSQYDSLSEAVATDGEATVLRLYNVQVGTNAKNRVRADKVGSPSEKALMQEAFRRLVSTPETLKQLQAVSEDPVRYDALLLDTVEKIRAERGLPAAGSDDEDEEDIPATTAAQ